MAERRTQRRTFIRESSLALLLTLVTPHPIFAQRAERVPISERTLVVAEGMGGTAWAGALTQAARQEFKDVIVVDYKRGGIPDLDLGRRALKEITDSISGPTVGLGHSLGGWLLLDGANRGVQFEDLLGVAVRDFSTKSESPVAYFYRQDINPEKVRANCSRRITLMHSSEDPDVKYANATTLRDRIGAKVIRYEGLGHFGGDWVASEVYSVLKEQIAA